ncbi:helix-turn-helix transcriptional regulator [Micromonospora sp. WMMD1082]|uniref:helix-turn-helix domain-containing protein n=1 Tax=Micromonospora sp. WMMD1082 TaxID=3016104 RepID=UPI002415C9C6|nr:helix-turn-helix transcriptional regulator [Micromonospora sp. WMMD1082]MDG4795171.1 helix-turn-helix transcriptional regulator [Micromonospora sp. WMMD1082]
MTRPSPYVRRRWLGREIRRLREEHGVRGDALARAVGFSRQQLSALENGHLGPDIDLVSGICDYLAVGANRRTAIMDAAADGWTRGWWMANPDQMGLRQVTYADLESGASVINEFSMLVPGLLQTPAFSNARLRSDLSQNDKFDPDAAVAARAHRQRLLLAAGGPQRYEAIIDETAVRRDAADPIVAAEQFRHIVTICETHRSVIVRVLPMGASVRNCSSPKSAYSIYRYGDPQDPQGLQAVAVDTLTRDLIFTDADEVDPYISMHSRLRAAALSIDSSMRLLREIAEKLSPMEKESRRDHTPVRLA